MATGRVVSSQLRIPRLSLSALFIVTPTQWWITDKNAGTSYGHGAVRNIVGAFATADGVTVALSETKSARFVVGAANAGPAKSLVEAVLGHAQLCTSGFSTVAPAQPPLMLVGTCVSTLGELQLGEECVVAVSGRGICATGRGAILLRPADRLRAIQIGDLGVYPTPGGWARSGFGIGGALEGPALGSLMNVLAMRRHVDCLVRFIFDDAEAAFSLAGDTPQRLHAEASALVAAVGGSGAAAVQPAAEPAAVDGSCRFCGAQRVPSHAFCGRCGNPYGG